MRPLHLTRLLMGLAPLMVSAVAAAQSLPLAAAPAPDRYGTLIEQGRVLIDSVMRARRIPGLSIAVSVDGQTVWSEGFGFAHLEQRTPVTAETKFRIGSISKPITAAALALLYEQGRLDLDAPVQRYVPSFPVKDKGVITSRLLAGHLAGVRHYIGDETYSSRRYDSVLEGLEIFKDDTLRTPPGDEYHYSSYGWNLLSAVIEGASGESFLHFMRENVFRPLGMRHTVADHTDSIIVGRSGFYFLTSDSAVINEPYVDNSYKWAGGGFLSTPEDLLIFANAHLSGGILEPETVELLWTSQRTNDGEETGYGIGWNVRDVVGWRLVYHTGSSVGGNCSLVIVPSAGVVVAQTTNFDDGGHRPLAEAIAIAFARAR